VNCRQDQQLEIRWADDIVLSSGTAALCVWLALQLQDAIAKAVASGGLNTAAATRKSINYAKMVNSVVRPYMFDGEGYDARRHLLQSTAAYQRSDKMQMAGMAAQVRCACTGGAREFRN
jgi:hypothetical protein